MNKTAYIRDIQTNDEKMFNGSLKSARRKAERMNQDHGAVRYIAICR